MGMTLCPEVRDHWPELRARLPASFDLEATARARGAFTRAREVKSAEALLRLALAYGACDMSLRETCAWAEVAGIAHLSDPALIERLVKAAPWLGDLVAAVIAEQAAVPAGRWAGYRLRVLDATALCRPGADRTTWRLHVGYDLAHGQVDHIVVTDEHGAESLRRLPWRPGDIALVDRGYARPRDLRPVLDAGAHFIVRLGWNSLRLMQPDGAPFDLFATLAAQRAPDGEVLIRVDERLKPAPAAPLLLRLVIRRLDPQQAQAAQQRLLKAAKKRGKQPDPRSLEAAQYILLLTALPAAVFPPADVLALYRFRWQIELAFKRMKSLAGLDGLPAKNPDLARAWIYARLLAVLLAEQSAGQVPAVSPSGPGNPNGKPVALAPHENGPGQLARRDLRTVALADDPQRLRPVTALPLRTTAPSQNAVRLLPSMPNLAPVRAGVGVMRRRPRMTSSMENQTDTLTEPGIPTLVSGFRRGQPIPRLI
jgi:Transposase DDE domain